MKFRPCIDIHNGQVKQIVGGSLQDAGDAAVENFVAVKSAAQYAAFYREKGLTGGHIVLLNPVSSPYYQATKEQALSALLAYPGGLQIGGGMNPENGAEFLDAGAAALIVTSYIFTGPKLDRKKLRRLKETFGREKLVLDLSCRRKGDSWYVVTDRWQTFTDVTVGKELFEELADFCFEFLIHGVDVEGKRSGMDQELVSALSDWSTLPVTYAGGIGSLSDITAFKKAGKGKLDLTIGSALDIFGGSLSFDEVIEIVESADS